MFSGTNAMPFTMPVEPAGTNNGNCNGWGGDGWGMWIWVILIFAIFGGWGNNGWGNGNGGVGLQSALTRADLCQDMNFSQLENGVRGIQQGICDSTFALNNSINGVNQNLMNGFHGVDNAVCTLGYQTQAGINSVITSNMQNTNALQTQLAQCCCDNRVGQMQIQNQMQSDTCALQNSANLNTRDIIESQNAGTRAILDKMCQQEIAAKDAQIAAQNQQIFQLQLAASQANQNNAIGAMIDASTAQIIRRTGNDCPIPAYVVPNPNCCYGPYGAGYGPYGGYGYSNGTCNNGGCCNQNTCC